MRVHHGRPGHSSGRQDVEIKRETDRFRVIAVRQLDLPRARSSRGEHHSRKGTDVNGANSTERDVACRAEFCDEIVDRTGGRRDAKCDLPVLFATVRTRGAILVHLDEVDPALGELPADGQYHGERWLEY